MKNKALKLFTAFALIAGTSLFYTGCKKEEDKPADANAASDNAMADNAFAGIWKQISEVTDSSGTLRSPLSSSASAYPIVTITNWNTSIWPKVVTIDFGPSNVLGNDYNNRRGIISAEFTGRYTDSATVITVTLTNYYHNDYHVQGIQTITNMGHNTAGNLVYNVVVNNATITHPTNGQTSTWSTNQNREFIQNSAAWVDDEYMITGTASGVSGGGSAYTIVVNTALKVGVTCRWIKSGVFTLTLTDYPNYPIVFDYGSGACDGLATATLNGTTYNIVMN